MAKFSKDKGKRGERQLAAALREYGYECRRAQQYAGGTESADVVGLPGIHIECKCYETVTDGLLEQFLEQAIHDSHCTKVPVVFWKEDHRKWHVTMNADMLTKMLVDACGGHSVLCVSEMLPVTMTLDNWMKIYREYESTLRIEELQGAK